VRAEDYETAETLFRGGGEMGALLRTLDWSQTPLGTVETWSDSLKTAVQILLTELDRAKPIETTPREANPQPDSSALVSLDLAAQLNAFCIKLADALRPLTDATEILKVAARILGEALEATRVIYTEVLPGEQEVIVYCNYTNGVAPLSGRYRLEDYRRNLTSDHQSGRTQVVTDIPNHPGYTDAEKARYDAINIAAHIDVPLIKDNQFVALLAVHQSTPRQWTEIEVKQVEETAERTWAAVERARAEAALRESEAKYRMLFESIDEGYFIADVIFDADDRPIDVFYLEANPAVKRITGLDLAGRSLREIDPNYESAWWEAYGRVVQTGIAERQELYTELLDSWFSFYTFKIGDADSCRVGCVFQDITQRKRTEQALRESEQRYRTLFESIDEAFCVCELMVDETGEPYDHRVLEINPAFEILTGLQQVTGKAASELIPTLEPFWLETYARVVKTGESTRFESYLQGLDGWFDVYVAPLNVFHSQQFAVLFRNITEQKRANLNAELLATVRDDLAEITEVGDIVQMVGDRLHRYLNISSCAFVEINERADEAVIHHHWHQSHVPTLVGVYTLPQFVAEEFLHTAQAGQPIVVRNVAADPRIVDSEKYAALGIGAELNIPLIRDGEWKFSLAVFHPIPYDWRDDEIALMQELASRIWTKLERASAEAALRDSRAELERQVQKFDATLSTITDGVFRFDRDGRFLYANQVLLDLWGLTATEAIGKTMAELNYPEAVERQLLYDMRQVFETGETVRSETAYTSPTGVDSYFDNLLSPVLAADGTVESVVGSSRNISDRKRVEIALRENEERFRTLADNMSQFAWMADETGWIFWYNQRWFDYTGTTLEEMQGWGWQQVHHPDHVDRVVEHFHHCFETGEQWEDTFPLRSRDGTYRWFLSRAIPIRDEQGQILRWFGTNTDISDRKQAEEQLREREQRLTIATEAAQLGIFEWKVPEDITIWENDRMYELFGLQSTDASVSAQEFLENYLHPDDAGAFTNKLTEAMQTGSLRQAHYRIRRRDGTVRWIEVNGQFEFADDGSPLRLIGVNADITDRKQAEDVLCQSEARFRRIFECEMVPMGIYTPAGGIVEANNSLLNLIGYTRQELETGQISWQALTPPEYRAMDEFAVNEVATRGVSTPYEKVYLHKDGREIPILIGAALLLEDNSSGVFFAIDLSERKKAEAELRESETRYRLLAEAIPQLVWMTDAAGHNEYVNQRFCDYTGLTVEQLHGLNWLSIIHPDDLEMTRDRWLAAVNSGQFYEIEYRFRRHDGSYRWFLGQGIPLKDEQGRIRQWFGTCTDIEPQKQIEQARLRLLQQEQVAREQAENANRIKDEFLAVLSHELRSPLNPILGWAKLLQQGKLDATRTRTALATNERNAQLQVQLIDDLLDISRILRGKLSLDAAPVDLRRVIGAALETVHLAAEAKSLPIQTTISPDVEAVMGDAGRLQQVVWNLLSNAVKFTPQGGQIMVSLTQAGTYAQIQVSDTGKGIAPDFLPYVFEHFRQEDGATTRKFGGLGLGLAIARQIVELHGGTVQAESPGENLGSTFTVKLPLITVQSAFDPDYPNTELSLNLNGVQVLVIDDEADSREFVAFVLEQAGASVTVASTASEGFLSLTQSPLDILLSDIGMPDMDGYMLMQQLRALPPEQGGQVKAIALTAYAGDFNQQQALQAGFQRHIAKPIEPLALVEAIATLIQSKEAPG
jgi:PAS domain S-box-containing protein